MPQIRILLLLPLFSSYVLAKDLHPEQIHLSFGDDVSEIIVTWNTRHATNNSIVEFKSANKPWTRTFGESLLFVDGGHKKRSQFIHKAKLADLSPNIIYDYRCGSTLGWSPIFFFRTISEKTDWSPRFAVFGDLGNVNARSLPRLQQETQAGMYDAILHVGDFAYDLDSKNARVGDEFMKQLEPIAAYVPYLTCPGNHEEKYNFSNYRFRFNMPGLPDSMFYSYNIGPAHIISFNTEYYYFLNYGLKSVVKQYYWLENDLKEATKPENLKKRPWIITFAHRPMYCSNSYPNDCRSEDDIIRIGLPVLKLFGLEKLFYDYGVDLEIWAHEHSYERLWPVYDGKVFNGSFDEPYTNPKAPVHIITGSAGCDEPGTAPFVKNLPPWSAFRSQDYGYTRMKIFNRTHLYIEQVSDDKYGKIIDYLWLIKNFHGPEAYYTT